MKKKFQVLKIILEIDQFDNGSMGTLSYTKDNIFFYNY